MTKKITAILLALCMAISVLPITVQAASKPDIKVGDYVKMGTYNNALILWRCVSIDDNGPLMLADRIIDTLAYDAKTNDNSNSKSHSRSYKRDNYGSNYWKDSNMRSWLNSTASTGNVDWLCGNPPKDGYVSGTGAYNDKAGFLNAFSKSEIAAMKTVTQHSLVSHPEYNKGIVNGDANSDLYYYTDIAYAAINYDSAYFETTTEKVFLLDVFASMNLGEVEITSEYNTTDGSLEVDFEGEDMGILIGKRGQTLDSLQYLTSLVVNKGKSNYIRVKLDTEDYRKRRKETLENLARGIAYKVRKTRKPVILEPMNPYERRIIHATLQNDKYVATRSEGEEPYRKVIVYLKKK